MKINGKTYCDVCLKEITNTCERCFSISGENLDDAYETQERHYCNEHRAWYKLWYEIKNGKDIGKLILPNKTEEKVKEKKEASVLEAYDVIMDVFAEAYEHLVDITVSDKDIQDYYKTNLATQISYNRLKIRGEVKDDKQRKRTKN